MLDGSRTPGSVLQKGWMDGGKAGCQRAKNLAGISSLGAGVGGLQPGLTLQPSSSSSPPHPTPTLAVLKGQKSRIWLCLSTKCLQRAGWPQVSWDGAPQAQSLTGGWRLGKPHQS